MEDCKGSFVVMQNQTHESVCNVFLQRRFNIRSRSQYLQLLNATPIRTHRYLDMSFQRVAGTVGRLPYHFKLLLVLALIVIGTSIYYTYRDERPIAGKQCYIASNHMPSNLIMLEDIMDSVPKPQLSRSVFFHETSCTNGIVRLNAR